MNKKKSKDISAVYILLEPNLREIVDLRKYETGIKQAVFDVCGSKKKVKVEKQYYELDKEPSAQEARSIGRKISFYCPELREYSRTYYYEGGYNGKSTQIFKRKRWKK